MITSANAHRNVAGLAFDNEHLDTLMDRAGLDVVFVTSKHNVQYLLGGHRSHFFHVIDAIGIGRYLPIVVYQKGRPERTIYIGTMTEAHEHQSEPIPVPNVAFPAWTTAWSMEAALKHLRHIGISSSHAIGIEVAFLPVDAYQMLQNEFPDCALHDAFPVLERLRARKRPDELRLLRHASERVIDAMLATLRRQGEGSTKYEIVQSLREEEVSHGLDFEYCLISMGSTINRALSQQKWQRGEALSIDSGGCYHGYIGDLARMAVIGEPDQELVELLAEVDAIQQAAISQVRPGAIGRDLFTAAGDAIRRSSNRDTIKFVAHGVGLVTHEAPRLTDAGPVPYDAADSDLPLEVGMVLSVETDLPHPHRGFIKLEDTIAVVDSGFEIYAQGGRTWNVAGAL